MKTTNQLLQKSKDAVTKRVVRFIEENYSKCGTEFEKYEIFSKAFDEFLRCFEMNNSCYQDLKQGFDSIIMRNHKFLDDYKRNFEAKKFADEMLLEEINNREQEFEEKKIYYEDMNENIQKTNQSIEEELCNLNKRIDQIKIRSMKITNTVNASNKKLEYLREMKKILEEKLIQVDQEASFNSEKIDELHSQFNNTNAEMIQQLDQMYHDRSKHSKKNESNQELKKSSELIENKLLNVQKQKDFYDKKVNEQKINLSIIEEKTQEKELMISKLDHLIDKLLYMKKQQNEEEPNEDNQKSFFISQGEAFVS